MAYPPRGTYGLPLGSNCIDLAHTFRQEISEFKKELSGELAAFPVVDKHDKPSLNELNRQLMPKVV